MDCCPVSLSLNTSHGVIVMKQILVFFLAVSLPDVVSAELVGHWTFENGTADVSGNGHDGTLEGDAKLTSVATVINGHAFGTVLENVDGQAGDGLDLMNVGGGRTSADPATWAELDDMTIAFWLKAGEVYTWVEPAWKWNNGSGTDNSAGELGIENFGDTFYVSPGYNTWNTNSFPTSNLPVMGTQAEWHHVAVTREILSGSFGVAGGEVEGKFYIDGELVASDTGDTGGLARALGDVTFGGSYKYPGDSNALMMDDIRMYDTVLSASQIQNLFSFSLSGDFDEDGDVDGADFLVWQKGFGGTYDAVDLASWQSAYGSNLLTSSVAVVPEPASWFAICSMVLASIATRRC